MEYRCFCTRERVESALTVIEPEELDEMIAEGQSIDVSCQFCGKSYRFTPEELKALKTNATA